MDDPAPDDGTLEAAARRARTGGLGYLVVTAALLAGFLLWAALYDAEAPIVVACDGVEMQPGDECIVVKGFGEDFSYEEGLRNAEETRRAERFIAPVLAVLMLLPLGWIIAARLRRPALPPQPSTVAGWRGVPVTAPWLILLIGVGLLALGVAMGATHLVAREPSGLAFDALYSAAGAFALVRFRPRPGRIERADD